MTRSNTKSGFRAKKSLGQNFLVNRGVLDKIISAAELTSTDTVLEIGPGRGVLTNALAQKVSRIVAVEKDHRLIESLNKRFEAYPNVKIVEADILKFDPKSYGLVPSSYKIVANIPYYITSNLLRTVFEKWSRPQGQIGIEDPRFRSAESGPRPSLIVLMVQKEVAQRICAKAGEHSLLSLSVQFYAKPEIMTHVSRGSFRPIPKVDSAVLRLTPYPIFGHPMSEYGVFFRLIKAGFAHKRKALLSNLTEVFSSQKTKLSGTFAALGIKPLERAQNVELETWLELAKSLDL